MQFSPPPDIDALPPKLPPLKSQDDDALLPPLSSLTAEVMPAAPLHWPLLTGSLPYRPPQSHDSPATMDLDASSVVSTAASDRHLDGASNSGLSLDDPDVRLAAEALGDLRAGRCPSPPAPFPPRPPWPG